MLISVSCHLAPAFPSWPPQQRPFSRREVCRTVFFLYYSKLCFLFFLSYCLVISDVKLTTIELSWEKKKKEKENHLCDFFFFLAVLSTEGRQAYTWYSMRRPWMLTAAFFFPFLFLFPVVYYSLIRNSNARVASFPFFAPFIYLFYIGRRSYIGMNYVARYTHLSRSKDDLSELHSATVQKKKKKKQYSVLLRPRSGEYTQYGSFNC